MNIVIIIHIYLLFGVKTSIDFGRFNRAGFDIFDLFLSGIKDTFNQFFTKERGSFRGLFIELFIFKFGHNKNSQVVILEESD